MTYRRLFLWILATSLLLLAGAGWQSLRRTGFLNYRQPDRLYVAGVSSGTMKLAYQRNFQASPPEAESMSFARLFRLPGSLQRRDLFVETGPVDTAGNVKELLGEFDMSGVIMQDEMPSTAYIAAYVVKLPLWLPWLVFVAGAFVGCRIMEKRAGRRAEKALASSGATAGGPGETILIDQPSPPP